MRRGWAISGTTHLALLLLALLGGQLFRRDEAVPVAIAEVELMTGAEFDAAVSTAPEAPKAEVTEIAPPEETADHLVAPESAPRPEPRRTEVPPPAEVAELDPDLSALAPAPRAEIRVEASERPEPAQDAAPEGASLVAPEVVGPPVPERANRKPEATTLERPAPPLPAPRIASEPAPKPPVEAREAAEASPDAAPEAEATEVAEETPAEAPPEAATEIVPEVAETPKEPESAAPLTSGRPLGRPVRPAPPVETAEATPPAVPDRPGDRPVTPVAETRPTTPAEARPRPSSNRPPGPPVTEVEKDGIRLPIKQYWNTASFSGHPDYKTLVVEVRIRVSASGEIVGGVEPWNPKNPQGGFRAAYDAARRAILTAARQGKLKFPPSDKYEQWKEIIITFDPATQRVGY